MTQDKEQKDTLIHEFSFGYVGTKMVGKENTYVLRNKSGFIVATAEKYNNVLTSFLFHKERKVPKFILNEIIKYILKSELKISKEAAKELGVSMLKCGDKKEIYLSSRDLEKGKLKNYLQEDEKVIGVLNSLKPINLHIENKQGKCQFDMQGLKIKKLEIGNGSTIEIDLRGNNYITEITVGQGTSGKVILYRSSAEELEVEDNSLMDIQIQECEKVLDIKIGRNYGGKIEISKSYLQGLKVGEQSHGRFDINLCIFYRIIEIKDDNQSDIRISSVFARYMEIGNNFSGKLYGSSLSPKQGIRNLYVGDDFSGVLDLSNSKTIQRVEIGDRAKGDIILISSPSIRLVTIGKNFEGDADFRESSIVYVSAEQNCGGKFECGGCQNLTLIRLPYEQSCKIINAPKPIKAIKEEECIEYWFINRQLEKEYFKQHRKSWFRKLGKIF